MIEVVISCIWLFLIVAIVMVFILLIYFHCQYCFFLWKVFFFNVLPFNISVISDIYLSVPFSFRFPNFCISFFSFLSHDFSTPFIYSFIFFLSSDFSFHFLPPSVSLPFCLLPPYLFKTSPHNLYHVICLLDISHRSKWPAASSCVWLPSLRHFSLPSTSDILIAVFFPLFICLFMSLYSHFYSFIFCIHLLKWWFVIYHYYLF